MKERRPKSCQDGTSSDAMDEHTILDSDAQSPEDTTSTQEQDVAAAGDHILMEKRDFEVSKNGDDTLGGTVQESGLPAVSYALKLKGSGMADTTISQDAGDDESGERKAPLACEDEDEEKMKSLRIFHSGAISAEAKAPTANSDEEERIHPADDQLDSLHTAGASHTMDARIAEHDNGQDAGYRKYDSFLTQPPVDEEDDLASDYGSTSQHCESPPTRDGKPRVSYEPGEAQPFGDEGSYQEAAVDWKKGPVVEDSGSMGSFECSPQERTRNDRNDSGSTYYMTQPDAENDIFGHVNFDHAEEDIFQPNF